MSPRNVGVTFEPPSLSDVERDRARFKNADLAPLTRISYERDFRVFSAWCEAAGRRALPATEETVELYAVDLLRRGRRLSTVKRHAIGVQHFHRAAGLASPCGASLRGLFTGAQRILCQRPVQKEALSPGEVKRIIAALDRGTPIAARDTAIILFGLASALRRSNLAALELADLSFHLEGVLVQVRKEKQDRRGLGRVLAVCAGKHPATCPVLALNRWLDHRGRDAGPLFCGVLNGRPNGKAILGNRITQIVQEAVARIGLDRRNFGAHSLRASFVSIGLARGANEIAVARQTAHQSLGTLRLYDRTRDPWKGNVSRALGL